MLIPIISAINHKNAFAAMTSLDFYYVKGLLEELNVGCCLGYQAVAQRENFQ